MSTLNDALNRICFDARHYGISLYVNPMILYLWLDTDQETCAPITGKMNISFEADETKICNILRGINEVTPIYLIKIKQTIYHITKTEEFMKKRCE